MATTYQFKAVILGNAGVGKSCLVLRFVRDVYLEDNETTIGAAFLTKTVHVDNANVKIEIWDTAGQERYRSLAPMYYRGAQAAIVVFDLTNHESFEGAKSWVKELQRRGDPSVIVALAGNKADLVNRRKVEADEAMEYAREQNLIYIETSAKEASNVEKLFVDVAKRVPRTVPQAQPDVVLGRGAAKPIATKDPGKSGCCA